MTTTAQWPSSVWEGNDRDWLVGAIPFYLRSGAEPRILDATWGLGNFWRGSPLRPVGLDLSPHGRPTIIADHTELPFQPGSFNVVVYDPPHMDDAGRSLLAPRYGTGTASHRRFIGEAHTVLELGGILLAKIADQVHGQRSHWNHAAFMEAASIRFTVCDLIVKVRPNAMMDPKWQHAYHARKRHSFWIVARKGGC